MPETYLPNKEADLYQWATTFEAFLQATPTVVGITPAQSTAFSSVYANFANAYRAATDNATRTPAAIQTKNDAKAAMISGPGGIRELVGIIQKFPGTTNTQRVELGITVADVEPSPVAPPTVAPEIDFIPTGTRTIKLRLHNETSLSRKKPEGVKGASIFYHVGPTAPAELKDWTFQSSNTRTTVDVDLPAEVPAGSTVWFTAFWFNPRLQSGPATTPVSTIMQYGGLSMAA